MGTPTFDRARTRLFSLGGLLMATFAPSAVAFFGFHGVVPALVKGGTPVLVAWPVVASLMLAGFGLVALGLLSREAAGLNLSLAARACLAGPTLRQWGLSLAVFLVAIALSVAGGALVPPLLAVVGFEIPAYLPFFLNPAIDPRVAPMEVLSPGLPLGGQVALIPLMGITLLLNILVEEVYFRAWMLPKMVRWGAGGWVANGILFAAYHTFQIWLFPALLGGSLCMAFLVARTRTIWPSFALHLALNALTLASLAALILR